MALLGKILLVINLLAAVGLVYLATQDYAKRQEISSALLRHRITLDGIPVPEGPAGEGNTVPFAVEITRGNFTTSVSKTLLDAHFGGTAPTSQVGEVKARKAKIDNDLAGMATDADKLRFLCGAKNRENLFEPGLLFRFADSYEERQAIRDLAMIIDPARVKANYEAARIRLDRKFDALINEPKPSEIQADTAKLDELKTKIVANPKDEAALAELKAVQSAGAPGYCRDDADRRVRIAQLLMLLDLSANGQKRTMLISGLKVYSLAVSEQAGRLEEIIRRIDRQIEQDQLKFTEEYELMKRLAQEQDQLYYQQKRVLDGLQNQLGDDDKAVALRTTQLANLKTELSKLQADVAQRLTEQSKVESDLFGVQKRVGETLRDNLSLEEKLFQSEVNKK
ncbi:MAG: hypothetical protein ACRCZF_20250 [Gemmataceae bacterium]